MIFFLLWAILVIRKGRLSWHAIISIYVTTLFIVDLGDVSFDHWFNFYDLPAHLLKNQHADHYLGIVFSDGMIFPLIAIIFCYYSVHYHRPWLLSFLFASLLGIFEVGYAKLGYMVYYHWSHWITPAIAFIFLRILAYFADRLVNYSPPISYRFRLLCFTYTFTEWPGALMGWGIMHLYQWRPHFFENYTADDRFTAMTIATAMGGLAAYFSPKTSHRHKPLLFLTLGLGSTIFALWMHDMGLLKYNNWNNFWTIVRYMTPYLIVYWYDGWETAYLTQPGCGRPHTCY